MHASRVLSAMGVAALLLQVSCESPRGGSGAAAASPSAAEAAPTAAPASAAVAKVAAPAAPRPKPEPPPVAAPAPPKGTASQVDLATLFGLQNDGRAFLVDVRPAFFYNLDHIPGAISLPLKSFDSLFPSRKPELDAAIGAGKVIVLYCTDSDCPDGRSTARKLAAAGYSSSVYTGGWKEWKDSGL